MRQFSPKIFLTIIFAATAFLHAQRTNPVDRQVANPITDTPNVNPISTDQNTSTGKPKRPGVDPEGGSGELVVYSEQQSVEGTDGKRILRHSGNVDVRYGIYRMQADRIVIRSGRPIDTTPPDYAELDDLARRG